MSSNICLPHSTGSPLGHNSSDDLRSRHDGAAAIFPLTHTLCPDQRSLQNRHHDYPRSLAVVVYPNLDRECEGPGHHVNLQDAIEKTSHLFLRI